MTKLKQKILKQTKKGVKSWKKGESKEYTNSLLVNYSNDTYQAMDFELFLKISPLFQQYPFENFERYLNSLKEAIVKNKITIEANEANLSHNQ